MAKLSDRILGERLSGFVTKPNILDNSNFQVRQRGDSDTTGNGGTFFDRWPTAPTSVTGGTTELLYEGEADYDDDHWVKVTAAGHTAPWYITQKWLIANGRITAGENYTFTISTEALTAPIKAKVFIRGYDVSTGTNYTLAEGDIDLDSNQDVSITLTPLHQQGSDLTGVGDYFEVGFTGEGADSGSDFVLPDGSYRFKTLKLEEGNVYTGDKPTPYAVDALECQKWFRIIKSGWTFRATTAVAIRHGVPVSPVMYFGPAVIANDQQTGDATVSGVGFNYLELMKVASSGGGTYTSRNLVSLSCEL